VGRRGKKEKGGGRSRENGLKSDLPNRSEGKKKSSPLFPEKDLIAVGRKKKNKTLPEEICLSTDSFLDIRKGKSHGHVARMGKKNPTREFYRNMKKEKAEEMLWGPSACRFR